VLRAPRGAARALAALPVAAPPSGSGTDGPA
jgi:hypothetical protein